MPPRKSKSGNNAKTPSRTAKRLSGATAARTEPPVSTNEPKRSTVARKALPMRSFDESLPMALLRAREAVMRHFRPGLRNRGVTEQQWRVLRALSGKGSLEMTALAAQTCVLAPSLSRILPELEARGLISRHSVESDARRSIVNLKPEGLKLISAHAPFSERTYNDIEARFGAERMRELFALLRALEEALNDP